MRVSVSTCICLCWLLLYDIVPCLARAVGVPQALYSTSSQASNAALKLERSADPGGDLPVSVLEDNSEGPLSAELAAMLAGYVRLSPGPAYVRRPPRPAPEYEGSATYEQAVNNIANTLADNGDAGVWGNDGILEIMPVGQDRLVETWRDWKQDGAPQLPLQVLTEEQHDGLWAEALQRGTRLKNTFDHYVDQLQSRQTGPTASIDDSYDVYYLKSFQADKRATQVNKYLDAAGFVVDADYGFESIAVYSTQRFEIRDRRMCLQYAVNAKAGVVVSLSAYAAHDLTPASKSRLKSSELLWQSWLKTAARVGADSRHLQVFLRHHIVNQEAHNILTLAHMRHPENVKDIPLGLDNRPLPPNAGHGIWRPDTIARTDQGDVFIRLLNTPNVKSVIHLLTDHIEDVEYPYITEIHTFPKVEARDNVRAADIRWSHIVLVLGKKTWREQEIISLHAT